jgi:large conductance mechanosensitive channel
VPLCASLPSGGRRAAALWLSPTIVALSFPARVSCRLVSFLHFERNHMEPTKQVADKALSLLEEFRNFAFKGNVVDLAVGVIIGAAFGKIVDSLVKQIIMPLISLVMPSDLGYTDWKWTIAGKDVLYGQFLGEFVNFLIVAFVLYLFIVKFLGWLMHTKREVAPPPPTKEQELLTEIRDLLKKSAA